MSNLKTLNKVIPFKWRVQSELKNTKPHKFQMIAYVDARDVAEHLDAIVGRENWCDKYEEVKGILFCSIGIKINGEWVYKSDCGVPSRVDKEKGESSDAFKRAAVKWGVNRDAYRIGLITLNSKEYNGKYYPVDKNGKWLKGQGLHDYCNEEANISELENFGIDIDTDIDDELFELKQLYEIKRDSLDAETIMHIDRIINAPEPKSYAKAIEELQKA
jgi:hypothetical protein